MITRIGVDVGGVLTDSLGNDETDTSFLGKDFMKTTPVPGAYDAVKLLVKAFGRTNVFIISKCGEEIEEKTRLWLAGNGFYDHTGFDPSHLRFCRTRAGKRPIAEDLHLSHFVDDRLEVLEYMKGAVSNRLLFGPQSADEPIPNGVILAPTWTEALDAIRRTTT